MDIFSLAAGFGGFLWFLLAFVVALSIIVAIHEYGHYIVGRWSGIHADVFSIGFGPVLWSAVDKRGTQWQIAALPFGGYVKFAGDANAASGRDEEAMAEVADDPKRLRATMHGAPLWARTATVAAGPVFNFILSVIVFAVVAIYSGQAREPLTVGALTPLPIEARGLQSGDVLLGINGVDFPQAGTEGYGEFLDALPIAAMLTYKVERDGAVLEVEDAHYMPPLVSGLAPKSAAIAADLQTGDVITAIDGTPISTFKELQRAVEGSEGRTLDLQVWRVAEAEPLSFQLTPKRVDEPTNGGGFRTEWRIGVASGLSFDPATETPSIGTALGRGVERVTEVITGSLSGLWHMIVGDIGTCNLSGPVGIAQVAGQMASQGFWNFVVFIGVLSTAVGFLNLFPIPALDGGHLVFYAYEAISGRPPNEAALRVLMTVGLAMVLSLMAFGLYNDLLCP